MSFFVLICFITCYSIMFESLISIEIDIAYLHVWYYFTAIVTVSSFLLFLLLKLCVIFDCYQVKRTLGQFTPAQWDKDEWHPLQGPWRFIQVLSLCTVFLTVELNTFFLKFCLWIPPRNSVVIYRLILWWLLAIPTIREYNTYLQDR
jgi:hypothetical protein